MSLQRYADVAALVLVVAGCTGPDAGEGRSRAGATDVLAGDLLVSAAASLTDAFAEMEAAFEALHPGVDVFLNLGASSSLRAQIMEGAPADVFASANPENMRQIVAAGAATGEPGVFARNALRIAVPAGNPAGVTGLGDFANDALRLGLCAEEVPCGEFARRALERAGVVPSLDTREPNVRALLTKVELGELDAGITYLTDVESAAGRVEGIAIPEMQEFAAEYPITVLSDAPNPAAARAFVRFVLSPEGRAILARYGFTPP